MAKAANPNREGGIAHWSVYTIYDGATLAAKSQRGEGGLFRERKRWVQAKSRLERARKTGVRAPILLADARHTSQLCWWGWLEDVRVSTSGTTYVVDRIRELQRRRRPQQLRLIRDGRRISAGFQRPYAVVHTPDFIREEAADGGEGSRRQFDTLWPSARERTVVANLLADSIRSAHQQGPECWVVTQRGSAVHLNVGQTLLLALGPETASIYVTLPLSVKAPFRIERYGPKGFYSRKAIGKRVGIVDVPIRRLKSIPRKILAAHKAAIEAAAAAKSKSPWKSALSLRVLAEIERINGAALPRPAYLSEISQAATPSPHRYWVVKGRHGENDFTGMLKPGTRQRWRTTRPPVDWQKSDRVFFWEGAPWKAVVGLGEIAELPRKRKRRGLVTRCVVRYLTRFLESPVGINQARSAPGLADASFLKAGPSGTFFGLTAAQAETLLALVVQNNGDIGLPWAEVRPAEALGAPEVDLNESTESLEGRRRLVQHLRRERSSWLRRKKVDAVLARRGRLDCEVCGFDFERAYGTLGTGFCEVHHTQPLGAAEGQRKTRLAHLAVVCSNCHRMIHQSNPPRSLLQVRQAITQARRGQA